MESEVEEQVEAVLLDSEGDPEKETKRALRAVVKFAMLEAHLTREELHDMTDEMADDVEEEHGV